MPDAPAPQELRELARSFVAIARDRGLTELRAELQQNGSRVEVLIERDIDLDAQQVVAEQVTVKVGAKSRPRTIVAAPAAWLED